MNPISNTQYPNTSLTFQLGASITDNARVRLGCSVTILDDAGRVLLQRRTDGDWWCLPGGGFDPGDTFRSTAVREAKEETGLEVEIVSVLGAYSDPTVCTVYPDGNRAQIASLNFLVRPTGGELIESNEETAEQRWFAANELPDNIMPTHTQRIRDIFHNRYDFHVD